MPPSAAAGTTSTGSRCGPSARCSPTRSRRFSSTALAPTAGERVLDVGCGGGKATIAAARVVGPAGRVIGADISVPLTELAAQRAAEAGVDNVSFQAADVQQETVEGGPFDAAMSQFGVMFFDEPATAFANIRAQLAPGGRIAFSCWQPIERNPWFFGAALAGLAPPPPPPEPGKSPTGPFALGDAERTQGILESAGFANVRRTAHDLLAGDTDGSRGRRGAAAVHGRAGGQDRSCRAPRSPSTSAQFESGPGLAKFPLAFQIFQATA